LAPRAIFWDSEPPCFFYCFWGSFRSHLFDFFVVCSCPTCWDYGTYFMLGLCVFL
jgi:hypothetical protein